jgi:hypothetical protein
MYQLNRDASHTCFRGICTLAVRQSWPFHVPAEQRGQPHMLRRYLYVHWPSRPPLLGKFPGCLSRILIFIHSGSQILGSRIQQQEQKEQKRGGGGGIFVVLTFTVVTNFTKFIYYLFLNRYRKKF